MVHPSQLVTLPLDVFDYVFTHVVFWIDHLADPRRDDIACQFPMRWSTLRWQTSIGAKDACQVLFQLSQAVFGSLGGNPLHDRPLDINQLLREVLLGFADCTIGAWPTKSMAVAR